MDGQLYFADQFKIDLPKPEPTNTATGIWTKYENKSSVTLTGYKSSVTFTAYKCSKCGCFEFQTSTYCPECGVVMSDDIHEATKEDWDRAFGDIDPAHYDTRSYELEND